MASEKSFPNNWLSLGYGLELYFNKNFETIDITGDPLAEVKKQEPDKNVWDNLQIFEEERVAFLNFQHLLANMPDVVIEGQKLVEIFYDWSNSDLIEEGLKILTLHFNEWMKSRMFEEEAKLLDEKPYELRLSSCQNYKRLTEINYKLKNKLISFKGNIVSRAPEVQNLNLEKQWECSECGTIQVETLKEWQSEPKEFRRVCSAIIRDDKNPSNAFVCKNKSFIDRGITKIKPVFSFKIEAIPEETPHKLQPQLLSIIFTNNIVNENFLNQIFEHNLYEFVGIPKLREIKKSNDLNYSVVFIEIQSFKKIDVEEKQVIVTDEEKEKIKEFLQQPLSLEDSAKKFGTRAVGFIKEKKAIILMKLLQTKFNKTPNAKPRDYLLHLLLCGDYGRGKSELAETCEDICERSIYLTASSTSGVGLAGATIKDEMTGDYLIQAGAYARASGDFIILEEFDKKSDKADFGILNEGMSKFQFTIAKANKYRKFKAETIVIMVANPIKKNFDTSPHAPHLVEQINIAGDLLSRFAFISAIIKPKNVEDEYKINEIMIKTMGEKVRQIDKENALFIKKCIKVATETDVYMDDRMVLEKINRFTDLAFLIGKKVDEEEEISKEVIFMKNITPRNRKTLIILTKAVAMWHCHTIPTEQDYDEAKKLMLEFFEPFIQHPEIFNLLEVESGKTMNQINEEFEIKMETIKWQENKETTIATKKGKRESLIDKIIELQRLSQERLVDIIELQEWSQKDLDLSEREFDETIEKLLKEGIIFEPKAGFLRKI